MYTVIEPNRGLIAASGPLGRPFAASDCVRTAR